MHVNVERGKAALSVRSAVSFSGILAGASFIAILSLCAPQQALAACGSTGASGIHTGSGGGEGVHTATARPATPHPSGGGGGSLGCANGASASALHPLHNLPVSAQGKLIETGARPVPHTTASTTTSTKTKTTNNSAHLRGVKPPPHA